MSTSARTAKALEASIAKWRRNTEVKDLEDASLGTGNCALCVEFHSSYRGDEAASCLGCPVHEKTGMQWCEGTPYEDACTAAWKGDLAAFLKAAKAEVEFLEGLRAVTEPSS